MHAELSLRFLRCAFSRTSLVSILAVAGVVVRVHRRASSLSGELATDPEERMLRTTSVLWGSGMILFPVTNR
jgi:hypothetical protein